MLEYKWFDAGIIDDSFKKIVITKDGLNPRTDDKGITVIDLFDFLKDESTLGS